MSHDAEIANAIRQLNDLILARNRASGRNYTLIMIPHSADEDLVQTLDGKPIPPDISPFVALNAATIDRYGHESNDSPVEESLKQERLAWCSLVSSWGLSKTEPGQFHKYVEASLKCLRDFGVPVHLLEAITQSSPKSKGDATNLPPMSNKVEGGGHFGLG